MGFFVKGGFRHHSGDFLRSLQYQISTKKAKPSGRLQLFWKLCQLDSSDYIKDATAHRLFATLALATREVAQTQVKNQALQRQMLKEIVDGTHVLAVWRETSTVTFPQVGFFLKPLEAACRIQLHGLTKRAMYRVSQKASMMFPKKDEAVHSSKKQIDLDTYLVELACEMHVQETQQLFAFQRLYWRLQRRYVSQDVSAKSFSEVEVPPNRLEDSICLFTGIKAESLFYHLYAQSIVPAEPGDTKGTFNQQVFAELLLHHNVNLCRLVAGLSFMFHVDSWKEKLRAEGKLGRMKKKGKKGRSRSPGKQGTSPEPAKKAP
jgi:hypothetical protein